MKKIVLITMLGVFASAAFTSCKETTKEKQVIVKEQPAKEQDGVFEKAGEKMDNKVDEKVNEALDDNK
ncbi:hypothetical protein ACG2LH_09500 [Zhouia sp. PK063]|uniref:hypothetical protein n=1 Tax=Zhouia sp. PK063 TaxID=3373602 RepID=UPI0037B418DF